MDADAGAGTMQLRDIPAGPALAAELARFDCETVTDADLVEVMAAYRRLASWAQAGELAAIAELAERRPAYPYEHELADGRHTDPTGAAITEFVTDEVAAVLTLTTKAAHVHLELALDLRQRLPATQTALRSGAIDLAKAKILARGTLGTHSAVARQVEDTVLANAPRQTTGELRAKVSRAVLSADPDAADRQRRTAETERCVTLRQDGQGTATLTGWNLPATPAIAAANRLNAIARALKTDGDHRRLDTIRADVFLSLLLGILPTTLIPTSATPTQTTPAATPTPATPTPVASTPTASTPTASTPAPATSAPDVPAPAASEPAASASNVPASDVPAVGCGVAAASADAAAFAGAGGAPGCDTRSARVDGRDHRLAACVPRESLVTAPAARAATDAQPGVALPGVSPPSTDPVVRRAEAPPANAATFEGDDGDGAWLGPRQARPDGQDSSLNVCIPGPESPATLPTDGSMTDVQVGEVSPGAYPDAGVEEIRPWFQDCDEPGGGEGGEAPVVWSGEVAARAGAQVGTVQLTVPLTTYLKLADEPGEIGGYGPILGEVARTLADNARDARWCVTVVNDKGEAIAHGDTSYRPGSKTRAMVQARDRTCRFPGCRRPAHRCDLDHSTPHDQGGATCPCNLAALCRRHHRLKQRNDWALHQVNPGVLMWVTPTDHWYMAQPDTYG